MPSLHSPSPRHQNPRASALCTNMPTSQKCVNFPFLRAIRWANFSAWCASLPKVVPTHILLQILGYDIWGFYIYVYVSYMKIVLYIISIHYAILKKILEFFFFFFFAVQLEIKIWKSWSLYLASNEGFSNFPHLKGLNKIKKACEYCDFLEL